MKTLLRSFFIQCSWNLERMQNLGFLYAIMPALKRVYPDSEDRKKAQLRHLDLFNSQPYMASSILGAVINLEKECVRERKDTETISTFKKNIMSGFAALGDSLFWNTWRPLCSALALMLAYRGSMWAPVLLLIAYNSAHLFVRVRGYHLGLKEGMGIIWQVQKWRIPDCVLWARKLLPVILGVVLFQASARTAGDLAWEQRIMALPIALICWSLLKREVSPALILLTIFGLALITAYLLDM